MQVVGEVKIEGGYRKPEWNDLFAYQLLIFPYTLSLWCMKYHRRYISTAVSDWITFWILSLTSFLFLFKQPLPREDQIEMSRDRVGLATWEELSTEEQEKLLAQEIWKQENYEKWIEEKEEEEMKKILKQKGSKALKKKKLKQRLEEEDEDEYIE